MSLINVKEINSTTINADLGGIKDALISMQCTSSGSCTETRIVSTSATLSGNCNVNINKMGISMNPSAHFSCVVSGKLKLVIPINLAVSFSNTASGVVLASEIFNTSVNFATRVSGSITRFAGLRKNNPSIVFMLYSLQYLNAGRIRINKNKYL